MYYSFRFASSMAFHVLIDLPHRIALDRHLSLCLASLFEIFAFVVTYCLVSVAGRRGPLCCYQLLVGATCLGIAILTIYPPDYYYSADQIPWLGWYSVRINYSVIVFRLYAAFYCFTFCFSPQQDARNWLWCRLGGLR